MPPVQGPEVPVAGWNIPPRRSRPGPPQDPVDHLPVIVPPTSPTRRPVRQQRLQSRPLCISQIVTIEHKTGLPGGRSRSVRHALGREVDGDHDGGRELRLVAGGRAGAPRPPTASPSLRSGDGAREEHEEKDLVLLAGRLRASEADAGGARGGGDAPLGTPTAPSLTPRAEASPL